MKRMNSKMQATTAKKKQKVAAPETETKKRKKATEESAASTERNLGNAPEPSKPLQHLGRLIPTSRINCHWC